MSDAFNYVSVLVSIVIGLGVTRVLNQLSDAIQIHHHSQTYCVHTFWMIGLFDGDLDGRLHHRRHHYERALSSILGDLFSFLPNRLHHNRSPEPRLALSLGFPFFSFPRFSFCC